MEKLPIDRKAALSPPEAAELLGLAPKTVYNLTHVEGFPALKVGTRTLIPRVKLLEWLDAHTGEAIAV